MKEFVRRVERDFFAQVVVGYCSSCPEHGSELRLDIFCNFGLTESLHHFNRGDWGGIHDSDGSTSYSSFKEAFEELRQIAEIKLDIGELSLHFKDTTIIITKVAEYSIPEQMTEIISVLSEHFVHITKGMTEMPYEIFIPIFEDKGHFSRALHEPIGYFDFWVLYFEDGEEHHDLIYCLHDKTLHQEKLFLLD
ncbi:MAG: hypothetical protein AAGD88_02870 [Bacteroidota bacterium]